MAQIRCDEPGNSRGVCGEPCPGLEVLSLSKRSVRLQVHFTARYRLLSELLSARKAEPNAAHYAMSKLAFESLRSTVAPNAQVSIITQNVDGLLPRALDTTAAKLKNSTETQATLIEMHVWLA